MYVLQTFHQSTEKPPGAKVSLHGQYINHLFIQEVGEGGVSLYQLLQNTYKAWDTLEKLGWYYPEETN